MDVIFERTGQRRYGVTVRRADADDVRVHPAPGFDEHLPHDLQHLVVELELCLTDGIFGRVARGEPTGLFRPAGSGDGTATRDRRRQRRKQQRRAVANSGADMARSEASTLVALHDWLAHRPEPELRRRARELAPAAAATMARLSDARVRDINARLDAIRARLDGFANRWSATNVGDSVLVEWPGDAVAHR